MSKYWIYYDLVDKCSYQEEKEFETFEEAFWYTRERAFKYYEDQAKSRGLLTREDIWKEASYDLGPFEEVDEEEVDELYSDTIENSVLYKVIKAISPYDFEEAGNEA